MNLGFFRRHKWLFNWFLVAVIAAFIWLYIPAFTRQDSGSPGETLAQVGGLAVTAGEFQRAYLAQRQRLEQMYQGRLDPATLRSLGLEEQILESLVGDRLVQLEARRLGLSVDDTAVAEAISKIPGLQESGRFVGAQEYRRRLDLQGRSVLEFEEAMRRELLREKLEALLTDGVSVTPAEAEREFRRRTEQLRAEYALVDSARFRSEVSVADAEVRARFEAKKDAYKIPERRVVSYLLLDADSLQSRVAVTDRDVEAYYQDHRDEFKQDEQVCASHILVKVAGGPAAQQDGHPEPEARKIAQGLLDQIRSGADFAALAKKASEDKGSAANGGDLQCFPRGAMKPEFENAAFSLGAGETSDLVKTDYGYHVIRVGSHREESVLPLAQVRDRIRRSLTNERVQALIEEKAQAVSDLIRRGRSLDEAAKTHGFSVQKSAPTPRGESVGPLASPALAARAFELKVGQTDPEGFPLPRGLAFIALAEVQPPRSPELKEVEARVKSDLVEERILERARALAADVKSRAEKLGLEKAAAASGLVRKETPGLVGRGQPLGDLGTGVTLEEIAYALPEKTLSDPVRVAAGYAILRVLEKKPFDPIAFEKQKLSLVASLREQKKNQLFQAYMTQARQRFPVERRPDVLHRVASR